MSSSTGAFEHLQAAHCESGVTAALLAHRGLELSEPMAFGLGSGIFFFFPPFVKVMGMPLVSFRSYPGTLFKLVCRRLGIETERRSYFNETKAEAELDALLARGVPVGLKTNMFWLSYFPREFRSQFNGHNLIALARDGDTYRLSDPMLEAPVELRAEALQRARFSKGVLAPRGAMYFPRTVPRAPDLRAATVRAIVDTSRKMLAPMPVTGVGGIRRLARHVRAWARTVPDPKQQKLLIGHVIRMQEEVGSGGAGFRYMYAAFLQEAGELCEHDPWIEASKELTDIGDVWRTKFAVTCARIIKDRYQGTDGMAEAADALVECADREEALFRALGKSSPAPKSRAVTLGAVPS
jgi:hypothetical protein